MGDKITHTRNYAIDFVKVIATLLVLNSHMGICYGEYSILATGGGLGDALFFFVSGFTLFLGRKANFIDWYKRRLGRIYPPIIAVALVSCFIFRNQESLISVILAKNYWFIQCILVCYMLLYPIVRYELSLKVILPISLSIVVLSYFFLFNLEGQLFYGVDNIFRWMVYFCIMLLGGAVCTKRKYICKLKFPLIWILLWAFIWYGINFIANGTWIQLFSVIPLAGFAISVYELGESSFIKKCFSNKLMGNILYVIGNLCLESYLIQKLIFTDALNHLFPLNIPIIMLAELIASYILHMLSETISQIFDSKPFDYKRLFLRKPSECSN